MVSFVKFPLKAVNLLVKGDVEIVKVRLNALIVGIVYTPSHPITRILFRPAVTLHKRFYLVYLQMRTMTSLYQGVCSCKIIQYCFISIIWSWKTIMFSLWTKRSEQCIHTSYNYFVLFQLPGVIWYMRIFYLTIAALVCASKRLNNDNSCLHLVNFCDETTRIDWYGELFFFAITHMWQICDHCCQLL